MERLYSQLEKLAYNVKVKELKNNFDVMHTGYMTNTDKGEKYIATYDDAKCYAFFRMASTTAVISKCLSYLPKEDSMTVLDLGAGTGASILACMDRHEKDFTQLNCVESSENMLRVLRELINDLEMPFGLQCIKKDVIKNDLSQYKSDIVLASFSINEMNGKDRLKMLNKMWDLSNKYILLIEPGTPKAYREMMEYKEYFISMGGKILAPCQSEKCPIKEKLADDWCHFQIRLQRPNIESKIKGTSRNFEDEKFTFLLVSKITVENMTKDSRGIVIRRPIKQKGNISLTICTNNNGIEHLILSKKDGEIYKSAKKLSIGDFV